MLPNAAKMLVNFFLTEERPTSAQRPALSSLYLYTIASEAKIELIEPRKPYTK
jgi:hypothetical protein